MARRGAALLVAAAAALGVVPFGVLYGRTRAADRQPAVVAGRRLEHPVTAVATGLPLLARDLSLPQILARRRLSWPEPDAYQLGCSVGVGLSKRDGAPILLLGLSSWGRLAEVPRRGIFVLPYAEASALAAPGRCAPLGSRPVPAPRRLLP